jgi:two-component system, LytTR family, sensor kinase
VCLAAAHNLIAIGLHSLVLSLRGAVGIGDAASHGASAATLGLVRPPVRCVIELPGLTGRFHAVWSASCSALTAFVWGLFTGVIFYAVVAMVHTALRLRRNAATLEAELTQAKLDTLRSQLRTHFLFNTLNAISVFVTEDAGKAQQMLLRLATLLRRSLDEEAHEVALHQELAFVNDYLDIQRERFGDRLQVQLAIDPTVLDAGVPVFLLQPILENAIEHGTSDDRCTTVVLNASRERDMLRLTLADDGPGVGANGPMHEGIGLGNTRARLHHLYGAAAMVALRTGAGHADSPGVCVEIRIPFRERTA